MFDFSKIMRVTSTHNTGKRPGPVEYIAIHYTAGGDASPGKARDNAEYYAATKRKASADFFVDEGGIVQYNPEPEKLYCFAVGGTTTPDTSAGGGSMFRTANNKNTVSIELCSAYNGQLPLDVLPNDPLYSIPQAVQRLGVELARYLAAEWDIPQDHIIRHFDVTGKVCPGVVGWNEASGSRAIWDAFKLRTRVPFPGVTRYDAVYEVPSWGKATIRKLCDQGLLQGDGGELRDVNGRPVDLDLSEDMLRTLVILDRAGAFDQPEEVTATC